MSYFGKLLAICITISTPQVAFALPFESHAIVAPQPTLLDIASFYNRISTFEARFQQYLPDGSISTGNIYIKKPGMLRIEYDNPRALIIANDDSLVSTVFKNDRPHTTVSNIRSSPLWHLIRTSVPLARPGSIYDFDTKDRALQRLTAYDTAHPQSGRVVVLFDNADGAMDIAGFQFRTKLGHAVDFMIRKPQYGLPLSDHLFELD